MNKNKINLILALVLAIGFIGTVWYEIQRKPVGYFELNGVGYITKVTCLKSHQETGSGPVWTGKAFVTMSKQITVCDSSRTDVVVYK